jgi:hypothetical protein
MIIIALAQIQMSFNVSALPVSVGAIVEDFDSVFWVCRRRRS